MSNKKQESCLTTLILLPFRFTWFVIVFAFTLVKGAVVFIVELIKAFSPKNNITGHDYEYIVADYLRLHGYSRVKVTKGSGDFGIDIIAYKGKNKYAVQCKYYSKPVGLGAVQEAVAGMAYYNCNTAMVVTNNTFTKAARDLADANNVVLLSEITPKSYNVKHNIKHPILLTDTILCIGFFIYAFAFAYYKYALVILILGVIPYLIWGVHSLVKKSNDKTIISTKYVNENYQETTSKTSYIPENSIDEINSIQKDSFDNKEKSGISEITGLPYIIEVDDDEYNIEDTLQIQSIPLFDVPFIVNSNEYHLNSYFRFCADIYEQKGYINIADALKNRASEYDKKYLSNTNIRKNNYSNFEYKKPDIEITNEMIAETIEQNIGYGALINNKYDNEIIEKMHSLGILKPKINKIYDEFAINEQQWIDSNKNIEKIIVLIRESNIWYNKTLLEIDRMSEGDFINYIVDMLNGIHYQNVHIVEDKNKFGIDIECEKDNIRYAFKCKSTLNKVSVTPIRDIVTGKNYHKCQVGIVVTNNYFTSTAKDMADANSIILWDRDKINDMINGKI